MSLTTVVMINAQEIPDRQLDFESVPLVVQAGITKALNLVNEQVGEIEEAALEVVTFPVMIDPEIGPYDFRISTMGPEGNGNFDASTPAIAYNSMDNNYLVVWSGEDTSGSLVVNELEIFGQLINANGTLLNSEFRISAMDSDGNANFDATNPSITYNPVANNYLVTWTGDQNSFISVDNEFEIFGQLVTNLGAETGPDDFRISEMGPNRNANFDADNSAIAYNTTANNFLVVWDGDNATNNKKEVFGQLIAADANEIGSNFKIGNQGPATNTAFDAEQPSLSYNSQENNYLVVWQGDDNVDGLANDEFEIYGQRIGASGGKVGSDFKISDMGPDGNELFDATNPAIAYNSIENDYLVVWQGDDDNESVNNAFEIYGQRLSAGGQEIGQNDFRITEVGDNSNSIFFAEKPSITYDPIDSIYLVVWEAVDQVDTDNEDEAWGQFIDPVGIQIGLDDFRISEMGTTGNTGFEVNNVNVIFNTTEGNFLAVWAGEEEGLNNEFEIYGQLVDAAGNDPCPQQLTDADLADPVPSGTFQASQSISSSGLIEPGSDVIFDAGMEIDLLPNFETRLGALLEVLIGGCE